MNNKKRWFLKKLTTNKIDRATGYTSLKAFEEMLKHQSVKKRDNYKFSLFPEYDASESDYMFQLVDKDGNPPKRPYKPPVEPIDPVLELEQLKKDHEEMKDMLIDIAWRYHAVMGVNDKQQKYLMSLGVEFAEDEELEEDKDDNYVERVTKELEEIGNRPRIHPPIPQPPKARFIKGGCMTLLTTSIVLFSLAYLKFIA
jgi:hypothetical protein